MKPRPRSARPLIAAAAILLISSCAQKGPDLRVVLRQKPAASHRLDLQAEKRIVELLGQNRKLTEARTHFRPGEGGHDALSLQLIENQIQLDRLGYKRLDERERERLLRKASPSA